MGRVIRFEQPPLEAPDNDISEPLGVFPDPNHFVDVEPDRDADSPDVLHLAELVPVLRSKLAIGADFSDDAILSSLKIIASRSSHRERWHAAFLSNLAIWFSSQGRELSHALKTVLGALPPPRN